MTGHKHETTLQYHLKTLQYCYLQRYLQRCVNAEVLPHGPQHAPTGSVLTRSSSPVAYQVPSEYSIKFHVCKRKVSQHRLRVRPRPAFA